MHCARTRIRPASQFIEALESRTLLAANPALMVGNVSSSSVTVGWAPIGGATQVRVYLAAEPSVSAGADLPGQVLVATLPGSTTSYTINKLAAAVDAFLRVEVDQPSGEGSANVHARTLGGPDPSDTVLDTPLREVHAYGPNILQVVMTDLQMDASGTGNDGAAWASGSWTITRSNGSPLAVTQVYRRSVPIGAYDMGIGYAVPYSDSIVNVDHQLFLVLNQAIGTRDILTVDGPFGTHFVLPFSDDYLETPVLQVNQVGYNPRATERWAYVGGWMGDGGELPLAGFSSTANVLIESSDPMAPRGAVMSNLPVILRSAHDDMAGGEVRQIDLSQLPAAEGVKYRVQIPGVGVSWVTAVSEEAVYKSYYTIFRGMAYQRWGVDLDEDFSDWIRPADHSTVYVGDRPYNEDAPGQTFNDRTDPMTAPIPMVGGWHDAGDFDQSEHHPVATQLLLRAFETDSGRFGDGQMNLPMGENSNGIPDALDEALWGVRGWACLQEANGGIYAGVESWRHPWGYYFADDDPLPYWTFDVDLNHTARVAGLFAQAAFCAGPYNATYAAELRQRATDAYTYARNNGAPNYLLMYGASELYRLTGSSTYKADFEAYWDAGAFTSAGDPTSRTAASYDFAQAYISMAGARGDIKASFSAKITAAASASMFNQEEVWAYRNLRTANVNQDWGNDTVQAKYLEGILAAYRQGNVSASVEQQYFDTLSIAADYVLGCNPNGFVWFTGLGSRHVENILQLDSLCFDKLGYDQEPGIGIYGITQWISSGTAAASSKAAFYPLVGASYPVGLRYGDSRVLVGNNEYTIHEVQAPHIAMFSALLGDSMTLPSSWLPGGTHAKSDLPGGMLPANQGPTVYAGSDQGIKLPGNQVTLSGQALDDGFGGSTLTTTWSKLSGPGSVTFDNASLLYTIATFSTSGTYVLQLHASDGVNSAADTMIVSVAGSEEFQSDAATVALYHFNEGWEDAGPNGLTLTAYGNATRSSTDLGWMNTQRGQALQVQNVGDYVSVSIPDGLFMRPRSSITIEARIKVNAYKVNGVDSGPLLGIVQEWDSHFTLQDPKWGNPNVVAGTTTVVSSSAWASAFSTGVWHRFALTYDVSTHTISAYVDDMLVGSAVSAQNDRTSPWTLTIGNFDGYVDEVRISRGIRGTNFAPVVNAGVDQNIVTAGFAYLEGQVKDDGLPGALTYAWSEYSGPGTVTFGDSTALNTTASFSTAGTYVLRLMATDGSLAGTDLMTIVVGNQRPWIDAGDAIEFVGTTTNLDGTAMDDGLPTPPGSLTYGWSKVSGPGAVTFGNPSVLDTTATFSIPGMYVLRATSNDGDKNTWDDVVVTARPANQYQLGSDSNTTALWNFNTGTSDSSGHGYTLTLNGNARLTSENLLWMTSPSGQALRVSALGDYATVSIPDAVIQGTAKPISLEARFYINAYKAHGVADTQLLSLYQNADARIQVQEGKWASPAVPNIMLNSATVVSSTGWNTSILPGVWYDVNLTIDSGGAVRAYLNGALWGTGTSSTNVSRTNNWVVTLGNFDGYIDEVRVSNIVRTPPVNRPPSVDAGEDQSIILPAVAALDGAAADDGLPNPPAALSYAWSRQSGPGTVTFGSASAKATTATFSEAGIYVLRLTASDGSSQGYDELTVTVTAAPEPPPTMVGIPLINVGTSLSAGRSQIRSITYQFSERLIGVNLDDFSLINRGTGEAMDLSTRLLQVLDNQVTIYLDSPSDGRPQLFLPDGNYDLVLSGAVRDATGNFLDANGDGLPGESVHFRFHKLLGDFSGDRRVTNVDFLIWKQSYGSSVDNVGVVNAGADPMFDLSGDGMVTNADYLLWKQRYGRLLASAADGVLFE